MSTTVTLRRPRPADLGEIAEIARDEIEVGLGWTWRPARIARTLTDKSTLGVVAEEDGRAIGFCLAHYGFETVHIMLLGVRRATRRAGLGTRLVEWHLKCARVAGASRVTLELRATNDGARRFYEALGFTVVSRIVGYYQGREDALRMALELTPP